MRKKEVILNKNVIKATAAFAVVAGLVGGSVVAPATAVAAPVQQVAAEQADQSDAQKLQSLVDELIALRPNVTATSWSTYNMDSTIRGALAAIQSNDAKSIAQYLKTIPVAKTALVPGVNLTTFTDPTTGLLVDENTVTAGWVDPSGLHPSIVPTSKSGPLDRLVDGKADNPFHAAAIGGSSPAGGPYANGGTYVQFDLGRTASISTFKLKRNWLGWPGTWGESSRKVMYTNTALVVANNPDFSDAKVIYHSGYDGYTDNFNLGEPTDKTYFETGAGTDLMAGKTPVEGRYVRLYQSGYFPCDEAGKPVKDNHEYVNHVVEVVIDGTVKGQAVDPDVVFDVNGMKQDVADADAFLAQNDGQLTADSVDAINAAKKACTDMLANIEAGKYPTHGDFDAARSNLRAAIDGAKLATWTVTFDDCIPATENETRTVLSGQSLSDVPTPVCEGYTFEGWFLDQELTQAFDATQPVMSDLTVYAKWSKNATNGGSAEGTTSNSDKNTSDQKLPGTGDPASLAAGLAAGASALTLVAARRVRK